MIAIQALSSVCSRGVLQACKMGALFLLLLSQMVSANRPPNILVVMADDLGCCDLSLYGGWIETPRLEQLAEEGVLFTDFHTNSSVCSPTRAAFLTGRYQQRVGIVDVIVGSREPDSGILSATPTLPRVFKDNGYATALFGKWHCGYQDRYNPVHHGFDEFIGFLNGASDYHRHGDWRVGLVRQDVPGYSTNVITNRSVEFIERNQDRPFFLFVSHASVHNPYQTVADTPQNRVPGEDPNRINEKNRRKYRQMLLDLDMSVGKLIDTLNARGLADQTLVFFLSDNGAVGMSPREFRMHRGGKFSQFEGGHRVPAIAWWPGKIKPGTRSDALLVGFDLFPTFAEIAGLSNSIPQNLDGISFRQHLLKREPVLDRDVFFGYEPKLGTAMRRRQWKMIVKEDRVSLYDLRNDAKESRDVKSQHPEVAESMKRAIEAFKTNVVPGS